MATKRKPKSQHKEQARHKVPKEKAPVPPEMRARMRPAVGSVSGGGMLLPGGVPGNRGGHIAAMRRQVRGSLLRIITKRGGLKLLEDALMDRGVELVTDADGQVTLDEKGRPKLRPATLTQKLDALKTALAYGAGVVTHQAIVTENDDVVEPAVVEIPAMNPPPVPPDADAPAVEAAPVSAKRHRAVVDAAALLTSALKG